jgi:predicted ATP-grasp superfamily ATP-dependent carboligase
MGERTMRTLTKEEMGELDVLLRQTRWSSWGVRRVGLFEYVCGGGFWGQPLPASLAREGAAMLRAVCEDLVRLSPELEVWALWDVRLRREVLGPAHQVLGVDSPAVMKKLHQLHACCDALLVIAPETGGVLQEVLGFLEASRAGSCFFLHSPARFAELCADKVRTSLTLREAGVPSVLHVPVALGLNGAPHRMQVGFPLVGKPRDGAGSGRTYLCSSAQEWERILATLVAEGLLSSYCVSPFCPGLACSVSVLVGNSCCMVAPAMMQWIQGDQQLSYGGGAGPLPEPVQRWLCALAVGVLEALGPARGYVGIDAVVSWDELARLGGSQLSKPEGYEGDSSVRPPAWVIEVNPRVTTSYVGLRRAVKINLAGLLLACAVELLRLGVVRLPGSQSVCFWADGTWTRVEDGTDSRDGLCRREEPWT